MRAKNQHERLLNLSKICPVLTFACRTLVILLILLGLIIVGTRSWFARSLPQTQGTITLSGSGLQQPVDILRDGFGVPHIFAQTDADMMFALGYVHAQDRLYQMEMQRRISSGNLAAFWGRGDEEKDAVTPIGTDRFIRTLGFPRLSRQTWNDPDILNARARADLSAYAAGVNAFINEGNPLPPEFTIARLVRGTGELMGPWTEAHSLAWLKIMSLDLGGNFRRELSRLYLAGQMEEDRISQFFAPYPGSAPFVLPDLNSLYGLPEPDSAQARALPLISPGISEFRPPRETLGSNNWVIDGSLMENGNSVLANDPHLSLGVPVVWYFAHISSAESGINAIGATFPGYPAIIIGRNDKIAWGFTNTGPDVQDLYVERISKQTGLYQTPTGWEPLTTRSETIEIAGEEAEELVIRETRHGPLLSDIVEVPAVFPNDTIHEYGFALQWTANKADLPDSSANAAADAFRSGSYDAFRAAMKAYVSPQQNIVVLEEGGRIGYIAPGLVPVRDPANPIEGWAPSPGWDGLYDWQGYIPHADLPQTVAPENGFVITANSDITDPDYAHYITRDWLLPLRTDRIHALTVDQGRPLTLEDMETTIHDQRINSAAQVLPDMLAAVDLSSLSEEDRATAAAMITILDAWADTDYSGDDGLVGPTLFFAWYRDFVFGAVADDLGLEMTQETAQKSLYARLFRFNPEFAEDLADGTATGWCTESGCGADLARSLVSAHDKLSDALGNTMDTWRWERLHFARSNHAALAEQIPLPAAVLKFLTGLQFRIDRPHGGGPYSVNASGFSMDETLDFKADHTASLRLLVEAGNFEDARFVHTQGQSGLPQSPHFDDLADAWAENRFAPMVMDRTSVEALSKNRLRLEP